MKQDWEYEVSPMYRVQVYYNLHKHCYSIRQSGRVIGHTDSIILRDVRFNVAPAGRDKVRATGVKNVHATVSGYMVTDMQGTGITGLFGRDYDAIAYNPCQSIRARSYIVGRRRSVGRRCLSALYRLVDGVNA